MIRLYDFALSPRVRKVRIVLAEKGLRYEKVPVDLFKGEQKKPEFLALNPNGKVPTLQDDGTVVYESTVIMEYLNDKYPDPPLLPADPGARARARILMHYADNPYEGAAGALARELLIKPMQGGVPDQEAAARARVELDQCLERLERELGTGQHLVGSFSLADIPYVSWALLFPQLKVDIPAEFPKVRAWIDRLKARPSVEAAG